MKKCSERLELVSKVDLMAKVCCFAQIFEGDLFFRPNIDEGIIEYLIILGLTNTGYILLLLLTFLIIWCLFYLPRPPGT